MAYLKIGQIFAVPAAVLAFIGVWAYCTMSFGILGFVLGVIAASIAGGLALAFTTFLWGPVALAVVYLVSGSRGPMAVSLTMMAVCGIILLNGILKRRQRKI